MKRRAEEIFEFQEKFEGLRKWAADAGRVNLESTRVVARTSGINRNTLVSALKFGRLSIEHQNLLAAAFGFSVTWPEWRETESVSAGCQRDTAKAFLKKFAEHVSRPRRLTIAFASNANYLDSRFANFSVGLTQNDVVQQPAASIPLSISLSFDKRGKSILVENAREIHNVGLTQVDVQVFHTSNNAEVKVFEITANNEDDANFYGAVEGIGPWWVIKPVVRNERSIGGRRIGNGNQDCVCQGFSVGDRLCVRMTARVRDCFVALDETAPKAASRSKMAVFEQLLKLAALGGTEVILGEQNLIVATET